MVKDVGAEWQQRKGLALHGVQKLRRVVCCNATATILCANSGLLYMQNEI